MDLFGIVIRSLIEGLTHSLNAIINFMTTLLYHTSQISASTRFLKYIEPLEKYTTGIAYTFLATFVLISILKQLVQEDDISFVTVLIRATMTAITISTVPLLMIYMYDKSDVLVKEMLSLITIEEPNITNINYAGLLANISFNAALGPSSVFSAYVATFLLFIIISLVALLIIFIQSVFYQVMLLIMRIIAPIVSLGTLSYNFELLTTFLKDVIGIYITRILQLVLVKVAFSIMLGSIVESIELMATTIDISKPLVDKAYGTIIGSAFIFTLIFMPVFLKKYTTVSGASNAIKSMASVIKMGVSSGGGQ